MRCYMRIQYLEIISICGRTKTKIYVLDQGKSLMLALQQDVAQARPAEAKAHIRRFHELFFTNSPSKQQIDYNISEALNLADNSAVVYYNKRKTTTTTRISQVAV